MNKVGIAVGVAVVIVASAAVFIGWLMKGLDEVDPPTPGLDGQFKFAEGHIGTVDVSSIDNHLQQEKG